MAQVVAQTALDELLEEIVQHIVRALEPERVILFGSYAEGRATADSDLDLLAVTEHPIGHVERQKRLSGLFRGLPLPVQVITISRQEYNETRGVIGGIAYPATKYGRILYEKT
jgi:predicted nucleotidyltransferase